MLITWLLYIGVKESVRANNIMVVIKLLVLALFVAVGATHINPDNYVPFAPNGWRGIHQGAAIVFFAYIGFDAISTAAEETKNPQRNMPIGILGGLAICTLIYVDRRRRGDRAWCRTSSCKAADPLAQALQLAGLQDGRLDRRARRRGLDDRRAARVPVRPAAHLLRDGARRSAAASGRRRSTRRYRTPHITTRGHRARRRRSARCSCDENEIYDLTNIGTLFAFVIVCVGVLVLRYKDPDRPRPFRVPLLAGRVVAGGRRVPLRHDGLPRARVGAVRHLAGDRPRAVLRLRIHAQQAAQRDETSAMSAVTAEHAERATLRFSELCVIVVCARSAS